MGFNTVFLFVLVMITFATGTNEKYVRSKKNIQHQNKLQKLLTLKRNDLLLHHRGDGRNRYHDGLFNRDNKLHDGHSRHRSSHSHERHNHGPVRKIDNHPSLTNIQNLNLYARSKRIARTDDEDVIAKIMESDTDRMCKKEPKVYNCGPKCETKTKCSRTGPTDDNDEYDQTENVDEVLKFLKGFDKKLDIGNNYNVDLRCVGNSLCQGRNDLDSSDDDVARSGKRLTDQEILLASTKNELRCNGKCARHGVDRDNADNVIDQTDLRCKGHSCGRSGNNNNNRKEIAAKVSNNVDAIILDTSIDNFLSNLNVKKSEVHTAN